MFINMFIKLDKPPDEASLMVRIKDSMKADSLLVGLDPNGLDKGWVYGQALSTVAFLAKSLSDENRLRVLISLREGRLSVSSLVEALQLSQPLISHHLKELKRSLLVKGRTKRAFYLLRTGR